MMTTDQAALAMCAHCHTAQAAKLVIGIVPLSTIWLMIWLACARVLNRLVVEASVYIRRCRRRTRNEIQQQGRSHFGSSAPSTKIARLEAI